MNFISGSADYPHHREKSKTVILVHVTTVPQTFGFFRGQIAYMKERGFEVHGVSSPGELLEEVARREGIPMHGIDMRRSITPLPDLVALSKIYRLFRHLQPTIVHAHTPKGGLIGVLAARLARVPVIIYGMHGLPFVTNIGLKRKILGWSETVACRLADRVLAVSFSNRQQAVASGFCPEARIKVLGSGSVNGVDAAGRFNPMKLPIGTREKIRQDYQIPADSLVLGFVGRIVRDKGIVELEEAWQSLKPRFPHLYLLLVGKVEPQDPVPAPVMARLKSDALVRFTGWVSDLAPLYAAMDILVLPTYREGFPISPLEAAAMELPVISTKVDGCVEAVVDGVTGLLVPAGDSQALAEAIQKFLLSPGLRRRMGQAGRQRVLRDFKPEHIWDLLYQEYCALL